MKLKKAMSLFLCLVMVLGLLAGCGTTNETEKTDAAQTKETTDAEQTTATGRANSVTVGLNVNIPGLSCYDGTSTGQLYINKVFNDSLFVQITPGGELYPCIGKEYSIEDDGATVTVTIFDYVKDSAGNPITASDVVFSYNTYIATGNASNIDPYVESIEAVDDTTIVFHLKDYKTIGATESVLTYAQIVSEAAYDASSWSTAPVGCGPYVVDEFVSGAYVSFKVNEDYWQTDAAYTSPIKVRNVDRIIYKIYLEDAQLALALETGDVDHVIKVSADNLPFFVDDSGNAMDGYFVKKDFSALCVNISFSMDESSNVANDLKLRQAILHCIDKASMVQAVMGNTGEEVFCMGTSAYSDYNEAWETDYFNYDVEKAKQLLAESDYVKNGSPTIRITLEVNDTKQKAAQMMQAYMNAIGINAEILAYDAALFTNYKLDFSQWDIKIDNNGNPTYKLGAFWARFLGDSFTSYNGVSTSFQGYNNAEFQALLDTASNIDTMSKEATEAAHQYLVENALVYGLWAPVDYQVAQDGILEIVNDGTIMPMPNAFVFAQDYRGVAG